MANPDIVVVYTPVGGGHKAAALAIAEAATARGHAVELLDMFAYAPKIVGDTYVTTHLAGHRVVPNFYGTAYFAANRRDGAFEPVRRGFDHVVFAKLAKHVLGLRPRVVIGTHHLPLVVLGRERRRGRLEAPLMGIVTDYTAHAIWAEPGVDAFSVPCALAERELMEHGIPRKRIYRTGIPVRSRFDAIAPIENPGTNGVVRVLITSGGFGVGPMRAIVRSFAGVTGVKLVVVCGATDALRERIEEDCNELGVDARIIGFERDMAARVDEAHIVVGKAGGLTVSEALTAGRPMLLVGTVPGNESSNEAFVRDHGVGFAVGPREVGAYVTAMKSNGALALMGAKARRSVLHNAAATVVDTALRIAAGTRRDAPHAGGPFFPSAA